jgi:acetyl esterase
MPLNAEARTLLDLMEAVGAPPLDSLPPEDARRARAELAPPVLEWCHETVDLDAGGVPARLYRPAPSDGATGLILWFHGGGWVLGDLASHDNIGHSLARRSGHAVLSVGYRLAPEAPFPAGLGDCIQATRWAHANASDLGVDPDRIAVGGDSAGANLAAVVCHVAPAPLVFQLLVYPVVDARMVTHSYQENGEGLFLTATSMRWFVGHYLSGGVGSPSDPRVSPLLASDEVLAAGPPALVITAGFDPLRDEGIAYADRLAGVGVDTSHVHFPGQIHGFFSMSQHLGDARSAIALAAEAVSDALTRA